MKRSLRLVSVVVVLALAGCMGSFTLTKKLYAFNETVTDSKIINNVIFWGLQIIPVYSFAVFADAAILNLIEFWTGAKLFADAEPLPDDNMRVASVVENADGSLTVTRGDEVLTLVPVGENGVRVLRDGVLVGEATKNADGSITAKDVSGAVVAAVDAEDAAVGAQIVADSL